MFEGANKRIADSACSLESETSARQVGGMLRVVEQERACARQETAASHDGFDLGFIAYNRGGPASTWPETLVGAPGLSRPAASSSSCGHR